MHPKLLDVYIYTHPRMCTRLPLGIPLPLLMWVQRFTGLSYLQTENVWTYVLVKGGITNTMWICLCVYVHLRSSAAHPCTVTAVAQEAEVAETAKGKSNIAHCWPPAAGVAHPFGGLCTAHDIPHSAGPLWSENWYLPPDVSPAARQVYEVMEPGCLQSALLYYIQSKLASQKMLH